MKKRSECTPEELEERERESAEISYQGYIRHLEEEEAKETMQERVEILWADYLARKDDK
jgi:hypothetical protein